MIELIKERTRDGAWAGSLVAIWALVMLEADLKVSVPYVHWVFSAVVMFCIAPYLLRLPWHGRFSASLPACLFVLAVCIPTIYGAKIMYSLAEAGKVALLLAALVVFVNHSKLAHDAFRGFVGAVWINFGLLIGGAIGIGTAGLMSSGRWGTLLNFPGSLSRLGVAVWTFAAYLAFKRRSRKYFALLTASTALIYLDGARTAAILVVLGAVFLFLVFGAEAGRLKIAVLSGLCVIGLIVTGAVFLSTQGILGGTAQTGALSRFKVSSDSAQEGVAALEAADVARFRMFQDGIDAVQAHPFLGTGILTTTSDTLIGPMVIHMTYLQVWADLGVLGLIAYAWLIWGWIPRVPSLWRRVQHLADPERKALYHNALFLLFFNGVAAFFHPLSTEWSEWILFIIPYALVWEASRPHRVLEVTLRAVECPV